MLKGTLGLSHTAPFPFGMTLTSKVFFPISYAYFFFFFLNFSPKAAVIPKHIANDSGQFGIFSHDATHMILFTHTSAV